MEGFEVNGEVEQISIPQQPAVIQQKSTDLQAVLLSLYQQKYLSEPALRECLAKIIVVPTEPIHMETLELMNGAKQLCLKGVISEAVFAGITDRLMTSFRNDIPVTNRMRAPSGYKRTDYSRSSGYHCKFKGGELGEFVVSSIDSGKTTPKEIIRVVAEKSGMTEKEVYASVHAHLHYGLKTSKYDRDSEDRYKVLIYEESEFRR
jgi:hypothetical protein